VREALPASHALDQCKNKTQVLRVLFAMSF
jgi:hypothetical protein